MYFSIGYAIANFHSNLLSLKIDPMEKRGGLRTPILRRFNAPTVKFLTMRVPRVMD